MQSHQQPGRRSFGVRLCAVGAAAVLAGGLSLAPAVLAAAAAGQPYTDISGNKDAGAITFLTAEGVLDGYADHTYQPQNKITRAEFTAAVVRMLGPKASATAQALADITPSFTDAGSIPTWAWGYINYAQSQKLINGFPDGGFRPNTPVTMVQAAAILVRAIGDTNAVTGTAWPANYTVAAYNLNLANGVTFFANLPATRGQVAQMIYDATLLAPTLQSGYASGIPTGQPLYLGGDGMAESAWTGTVSTVTSSDISLNNAQGQSLLSAPLASSYYLLGSSSVTTLQGESVTVAENSQGQVDFIQVNAGQATQSATLATASVATPAGYSRVDDWTVQNGGVFSLLLSNGSLVPLASPSSGAGTDFYLNAPAAGVGADARALVGNAYDLAAGDSVIYVVNSAGQAITVYASGPTAPLGVVDAVSTTNNTLTYSTGTSDTQVTSATIQPWTVVTLNGAQSTLSALQPGDVVSVSLVGGGNGDANARSVHATRQSVSGTIDSLNTTSNGSTTTVTIGITESGGQTTSVVEDPSFDDRAGALAIGQPVTLLLDAQGQARQALPAVGQQAVVLVEGTQQSTQATTAGVQTVNEIVADSAGQKQTYNLANGLALPPAPAAPGYLAVVTFQPGTNTVTGVTPLNEVATGTGTLKVLTDSGGTIAVQEYNSSGEPTSTAFVLLQSSGAVAYNGGTYVPFADAPIGQTVSVWATASGEVLGMTY